MDVEARLLLYTVALGAVIGLAQLLHRRAFAFRVYMIELGVLLAVASAGVAIPGWTRAVAWPSFSAFLAVAIAPSALLEAARRAARSRRYGFASATATTGAALLGMPEPLRREAALYGAMAAAERGDDAGCRRRLERVSRTVGIPPELGGEMLVRVLPAASRRRWDEVLALLASARATSAVLLALEVRAASDTGDLGRATRACLDLELREDAPASTRAAARRCLLAAAGRTEFLAEAVARKLPLMAGPPGTAEFAAARSHEARGDAKSAAAGYAAARSRGRGSLRADAEAGLSRCGAGALVVARAGGVDPGALDGLEATSLAERSLAGAVPLRRRAPATLVAAVLTAVASIAVFLGLGTESISLVSAGALSAPLIRDEGEWWRLGATMLLHGGWVHLGMNLGAILFVGVPYETRSGWARTAIVYLGSGFAASAASAFVADTGLGVGASGAGMGLIGALGVLVLRRPALFGATERRRWLAALGITVLATLAVGIVEIDAIDNAAHAGGFLAGAALGSLLLPTDGERRAHAVMRRVAAIGLCAVMIESVWVTVARMGEWRGERTLTAPGARCEIPAWLRETPAKGAIVARRPPIDFAVHLGAEPDRPLPALVLPDSDEVRRLFAKGPVARDATATGDGLAYETAEYTDESGAGFRLRTFRRGTAFALVLVPIAPDGVAEDDAAAFRIARSLTPVQ